MCYTTACHPRWKKHHRRHHSRGHWKNKFAFGGNYPPVNVEESDNQYEIQLFAAGYNKSDFQITLEDNILLIAAEKPNAETKERTYYRGQQLKFKPSSFERRFELNDKIDTERISAKYEAGVLKVALPKLAGSETTRQAIDVE